MTFWMRIYEQIFEQLWKKIFEWCQKICMFFDHQDSNCMLTERDILNMESEPWTHRDAVSPFVVDWSGDKIFLQFILIFDLDIHKVFEDFPYDLHVMISNVFSEQTSDSSFLANVTSICPFSTYGPCKRNHQYVSLKFFNYKIRF